jgi:hypothetical protein
VDDYCNPDSDNHIPCCSVYNLFILEKNSLILQLLGRFPGHQLVNKEHHDPEKDGACYGTPDIYLII